MKIIIDPKGVEIVYVKCDDGYVWPMYLVDIDPKAFEPTPKNIKGGADGKRREGGDT